MARIPRILICDDDSLFHLTLKQALRGRFECRSAMNGDEALAIVRNHKIDLLVLDVQMRTPTEGLDFIPSFREVDPDLAIVVSSGLTDFATVREALRHGANDYVAKDFDPDQLIHTLGAVLERRALLRRAGQQNFEAERMQRRHVLVGESPPMKALRRTLEKIRDSAANVVITGETGTGKEVVARQLRSQGPDGILAPFVAVDASTIQSSLAESVLFGHEKGAFTGADKAAKGIFEEADGGIVYFDEIANLPASIQPKLLRVLQEREVVRLGSARPVQLEFRVVCATNRRLESLVERGEFKADLFQRLNVLTVDLPPLRERREDIPELIAHFASVQSGGSRALELSAEALGLLTAYAWPGNVRELANLVAYALAMSEDGRLAASDLPEKFRDGASARSSFQERMSAYERDLLAREYSRVGGNVSRLAQELSLDRSHLHKKLKDHGIHHVATRES